MTVLNLRHSTVYRYRRPVTFGEHRMMFRPRDSHDLRLIGTGLRISPAATIRWHHDVFANSIGVASFDECADKLIFESEIKVEHYVDDEQEFVLEPHAQTMPFSYSTDEIPDLGRTRERHYADPDHLVDEWARQFLVTSNGNDGPDEIATMDVLTNLTKAIPRQFEYRRRYAEVTQTPIETLRLRSGSCRDYAVLMMEAVRTFGLAARFVSGYVYDPQLLEDAAANGTTVGTGETHAWVQIYLPGAGWVEFDPTNGLIGGVNLIRVAVARDPRQAIPLTGTFVGAADDFVDMEVTVEIRRE
jgi:transglutaminase-like putative cysteine protease